MKEDSAVRALAALSHPIRLRTFRLLMKVGPTGLSAGEIAGTLAVPRSTLSAHLGQLEQSGLLAARRVRQQIFYSIDDSGSSSLIQFLVEDCCRGRPDLCGYPPRAPQSLSTQCGFDLAHGQPAATPTKCQNMSPGALNVLFLCTANTARSILAECLLNRLGGGRFKAYSAGSQPGGRIHPLALEVLERNNYPSDALRSKSWDEFGRADAPTMHFVFTVCDSAAAEQCPIWPGHPTTAHWGITDPAAAKGEDWELRAAFTQAFAELQSRISLFVNLPFDALEPAHLQLRLDDIGRLTLAATPISTTVRS